MSITLKQLAEMSGMSVRTVSRVLKNQAHVQPEKRELVMRLAQEHHYVPNVAARSLRNRSYRMVGVIFSKVITEFSQTRLVRLESCLHDHGYHVLLGGEAASEDDLIKLLRDWSGLVSHVVFLDWHSTWNPACLKDLPQKFLFFDCGITVPGHAGVLSDRSHGVALAVGSLIQSGCRRIAHVCRDEAVGRRAGVARAVSSSSVPIEVIDLHMDGMEMKDGYASGERIINSGADGAFFDTDRMALGFYRYAYEHGIRLPRDLAVAAFDDDRASAYATPTLTTVSHAVEQLVETVVDWVSGEGDFSQPVICPTCLVARESSKLGND